MTHEPNTTYDRPQFQIINRRRAPTRATALAQKAKRSTKAKWWKLLERLSLILGITGFSVTTLVAGVEKYLDTMQALAALQNKVVQLEAKLGHLQETNTRLENELVFVKGRLEPARVQPQTEAAPTSARENLVRAPRGNVTHAPSIVQQNEPNQISDTRAPLHVIDKLNMTISYAYRKARSDAPNLAGRMLVKCVVNEEGNLTDSEVLALDPEVEGVAAYVRDKVRRWNFPATVTGLEEGNFQKTYFLTPSGF